jgi:mRNA interferase MazF
VICESWQVVVVPFPFTDRTATKRRPALILSEKSFNRHGHTVLAMITSAAHGPWPGDTRIEDAKAAGLEATSIVRLKLFTLDNRFIARQIGALGPTDRASVTTHLREVLRLEAVAGPSASSLTSAK